MMKISEKLEELVEDKVFTANEEDFIYALILALRAHEDHDDRLPKSVHRLVQEYRV